MCPDEKGGCGSQGGTHPPRHPTPPCGKADSAGHPRLCHQALFRPAVSDGPGACGGWPEPASTRLSGTSQSWPLASGWRSLSGSDAGMKPCPSGAWDCSAGVRSVAGPEGPQGARRTWRPPPRSLGSPPALGCCSLSSFWVALPRRRRSGQQRLFRPGHLSDRSQGPPPPPQLPR